MQVTYPGDVVVNLGNELRPMQTKDKPEVKWEAEKGAFYTLIKVDPDVPSRKSPVYRELRHCKIFFQIYGSRMPIFSRFSFAGKFSFKSALKKCIKVHLFHCAIGLVMNIPESDVEKGDEVFEYIGAGPPASTGLHRYVFLVYKQPNGKIEHNEPRTTNK